jgi:aryl-alcohol dehydrogenase-like predicted oxidoreductase
MLSALYTLCCRVTGLKNPNVSTVITGASKVSQVAENMKALDVAPKLTPNVMERIEKILNNKPELVGDFR